MELTRRGFLKASLVLAVASALNRIYTPSTDSERLNWMIESGLIENQTFYIDEPLIITVDNLTIRNCKFIATCPLDYFVYVEKRVAGLTLDSCNFYGHATVAVGADKGEDVSGHC